MRQNGTNVKYTGKRKMIAETLANPDFTGTITELIKQVGVPRSTFYRWLEDEQYLQYINNLIDKYTDSELPAVWKALVNQCKQGDVKAIKLYFELKGKYNLNIKADLTTNYQNPFADISTEDLKKLIADE